MNRKNALKVGVLSSFAIALMLFAVVALPNGMVRAEGIGDDFGLDWDSFSYGDDFSGGGNDFEPYGNDFEPYGNDFEEYDFEEYGNEYEDDYYEEEYYQDDYGYSGGGSYGGGSTGGGYSYYPKSVTPVSVYSPKYPSTPSAPTTITNTNNNSNVNINNNTAIAVAQVQIGSQQAPAPTYQAPYCTIHQAQYGQYGSYNNYGTNQVYLSWTSSNASSAYLSGYGSVSVTGSQTVYSSYTQVFTLTVYGYNGQQATCQTTVNVNNYVPATPYVSLTQIPYTGFDFGPFGNAMYWAGMIVFALAGAYLAVYFIPGVAFAGVSKRAYAPVVAPKAPILAEKEAALEKVAPIVASLRKVGTNDAMAIVKSNDGSMPKIVVERY